MLFYQSPDGTTLLLICGVCSGYINIIAFQYRTTGNRFRHVAIMTKQI